MSGCNREDLTTSLPPPIKRLWRQDFMVYAVVLTTSPRCVCNHRVGPRLPWIFPFSPVVRQQILVAYDVVGGRRVLICCNHRVGIRLPWIFPFSPVIRQQMRWEGGGAYSFIASLSRITIDHASLTRRRRRYTNHL